jgi:hypothetical protein
MRNIGMRVKEHEIEGEENADHQGFENKESDHIFLDAILNRLPRRENADRHQESSQQDERKRYTVNAHLVDEAVSEPAFLLDELKSGGGGIEPRIGIKRQEKDDDGRSERGPAGVFQCGFVVAAQGEDKARAGKRQKDDAGQNAEAKHQRTPQATYQVMTAARPASMAKA